MIRNLRDTTRQNVEQDWLKTNLARFSRLLQGHRDLRTAGNLILSELVPLVGAQRGVFYVAEQDGSEPVLSLLATYATEADQRPRAIILAGEGLIGQAAVDRQRILLHDLPTDYVRISSGLGQAPPRSIVILPIVFEDETRGV